VEAGGGLVIVTDPDAEPGGFNDLLASEGADDAPLAPARLAGSIGHERDPQSYQGLRDVDAQHPLFARLRRGGTPVDWGAAVFFRAARVEVADRSRARVLARFTSGSPAVVEHRVGAGRVVLVASSLHADAGTFPLRVGFVPFVHGLVAHLAAPERSEGQRVGDRLRLLLPAAGSPPSAKVAFSAKEVREAKPVVAGGFAAYDFGAAAAPGTATFEWLAGGRIESRRVAVNVNPDEGVLDYAEPGKGVPGAHRVRTADELTALLGRIRRGWSLATPFLVAALLAALAEALLANRFAFGAGRRAEAADAQ
jgi:hypothetical protein